MIGVKDYFRMFIKHLNVVLITECYLYGRVMGRYGCYFYGRVMGRYGCYLYGRVMGRYRCYFYGRVMGRYRCNPHKQKSGKNPITHGLAFLCRTSEKNSHLSWSLLLSLRQHGKDVESQSEEEHLTSGVTSTDHGCNTIP